MVGCSGGDPPADAGEGKETAGAGMSDRVVTTGDMTVGGVPSVQWQCEDTHHSAAARLGAGWRNGSPLGADRRPCSSLHRRGWVHHDDGESSVLGATHHQPQRSCALDSAGPEYSSRRRLCAGEQCGVDE